MSKSASERDERFERWLADVADHLGQHGHACRLGYDDGYLGDRMYLSVTPPAGAREPGYAELALVRGRRSRVVVYLFADTRAVARAVAGDLDGMHRRVGRARNAKRKFVHLLERLALRLTATFDARAREYPRPALARLAAQVPGARPMIGIAGHQHVEGGPSLDQAEYAAMVPAAAPAAGTGLAHAGLPQGAAIEWRALRYDPEREAFEAHGALLAGLQARLRDESAAAAAAAHGPGQAWAALGGAGLLVAGSPPAALARKPQGHEDGEAGARDKVSWLDALDCGELAHAVACDACDLGLADLGPCDTPDCDVCDVPSCDIGGCDL